MARLTTYLDIESCKILRSGFDFMSNLTSSIGNLANHGFLASYVSRHTAMAYDPQMKLSDVIIMRKKPLFRKKINRHDCEVMEDVRTVLLSNTHKIL